MRSKITDFHVRVWDNDVFIHDKYNLDYASMAEMEGFQCNYREGTKEYADLRRVCGEIAEKFKELGALLKENSSKGGNLPTQNVPKYAEAYIDPTGHEEDYRELLRRGHKETIELAAEMFRNIEESKKYIKISPLSEKS